MDKYPISEMFISPQGEGQYTGTMMAFIRLAGCTVGKPYKADEKPIGLPIYTEKCTLYDGRTFSCDTDYRVKERLTIDEIFDKIKILQRRLGDSSVVRHICITGGEPFIHNLEPFSEKCSVLGLWMHVETSGTIPIEKAFPTKLPSQLWVTVSPKFKALPQMLTRADEVKILIDEKFDITKLPIEVVTHPRVYIQPVNFEHAIDPKNLELVVNLQKKYPSFRISVQLHKVLSHFTGERVF